MRNFEIWLASMKESISGYKYYVDFEKVHSNIETIKTELNILNTLIGSKNIESEFIKLVGKYPEVIKCVPLLLAVRAREIYAMDDEGEHKYNFVNMNYPIEKYCYFMRETGLFNLLEEHIVSNLVDYATGVETGLDSNARKNRGGHQMEQLVETYLRRMKEKGLLDYFKEMNTKEISDKWGLNLSNITNKGKTVKKFDFVVKTVSKVYAIETNFYASSGSKLNETARSYKNLSIESQQVSDFEFVWVTDGKGWMAARNNLEETFDIMEHLYNIKDLEDGVFERVFV